MSQSVLNFHQGVLQSSVFQLEPFLQSGAWPDQSIVAVLAHSLYHNEVSGMGIDGVSYYVAIDLSTRVKPGNEARLNSCVF